MGWKALYNRAASRLHPRVLSPFVKCGKVAAVFETPDGRLFEGVNVNTECDIGFCAERAAAAAMITQGQNTAVRLVCVYQDGSLRLPCGTCREFLMQLSRENAQMDILTNLDPVETVTLAELMPNWWGDYKYQREEACQAASEVGTEQLY